MPPPSSLKNEVVFTLSIYPDWAGSWAANTRRIVAGFERLARVASVFGVAATVDVAPAGFPVGAAVTVVSATVGSDLILVNEIVAVQEISVVVGSTGEWEKGPCVAMEFADLEDNFRKNAVSI